MLSFWEKVFLLLMGCSKNYIMYWGLRILLYHHIAKQCAQSLHFFAISFVSFA